MKTEAILTRVNHCADALRDHGPESAMQNLNLLIADLEAALRAEIASSKGVVNAQKTIVAMLKENETSRKSLAYPWIDGQNRQCVCDGFKAFRLVNHLPLPERPENAGATIDLDKLYPRDTYGMKELPMPSAADVKASIAIGKATHGKAYDYEWDFGPEAPSVNAKYLLDVMKVFPDAEKLYWNTLVSPLYIPSKDGDALLLPIKKSGKHQPEPKSDAERAAIAAEHQQTEERKAEADKRYETIRKAHDDFDAAADKVAEYNKKALKEYDAMKKAESSGVIAEHESKCLDMLQKAAEWELKRHAARLVFDPEAYLEMETVEHIVKGLNRIPTYA